MFGALGRLWGERIGKSVVDEMVASGQMKRIVAAAMARQFRVLADKPENAGRRQKLLDMASRAEADAG